MDQKIMRSFQKLFYVLIAAGLISVLALVVELMRAGVGYRLLFPIVGLLLVGISFVFWHRIYQKIKGIPW
ncbi:hypothetical protein GGG87_00370 [Streptococcus sp. zg-86]|uniref:Uncharacterized protein n=1 Tax=Streptococcus zhangguiae TaxID=2664091 RepID=A0A6I4RN45_9STRE|nr:MULTISPECIES: hypothetical protein [unclassified Streptococcus]MTB63467.1 hypothetical protein [Streptococcus sp. zg-86]MTB89884.1 hypothetical protein [Streptococcus sp. zg-36]MWV55555.1 hypothetical protein [Streptococcus sp. zg-70]QTH47745.1 hypothetical protein J5M87_09470 [Streptococcus sp. zg-86]